MANLGKVIITPKGAYSAIANYAKLDCVLYGGSTWLALQASVGVAPVEGAYWTLMAQGFTANTAHDITYDNTASGMAAVNVQNAIDEVALKEGNNEKKTFNNSLYISKIINKMQNGETVTIVCYGDSTTWGDTGTGSQTANPYPATLQTRLRAIYGNNNITVLNNGHNGQQSSAAVANFDTEVVPLNPDLVIIMYGINDISGYILPIITIDNYKSNMIGMVEKCINNNFKVLLLTPVFTKTPNLSNPKILQYGECVKEIANQYKLPCIDMHKEQEKFYQSGSLSIAADMNDGAHRSDFGYRLMASIISQKLLDTNMTKPLIVDGTQDIYVPAVQTKYIKSDCTGLNTSTNQYIGASYVFRKDGSAGTYLSMAFYVNQAGMDLVLFSPKGTGGGTIQVTDNGTNVSSVNFYYEEQICYDAPSLVVENLAVGYHVIEFKTSNLVVGDATTDTSNPYMYVSYFMFTRSKLAALNLPDISKVADDTNFATLTKFIPVVNGKNSLRYDGSNGYANILMRSENWAQTKQGKTLVIEFDGYFFDKCGVCWFGNSAGDNNTFGRTLGFILVFKTTEVTLYQPAINAGSETFTNSNGVVTLDYSLPHKVGIEHEYDGTIRVYIDNTNYITCNSKRSNSGYFGLYNQPVSGKIMRITRFEYAYK
jgi:lysophospholipase L1-like esterase